MSETDTTPLWEASTDQILDELKRRFDCFLFTWAARRMTGVEEIGGSNHGSNAALVGLAEYSKHQLMYGDKSPFRLEEDR